MHNILVSNVGFGEASPTSLGILHNLGNVVLNEEKIRFREQDFIKKIFDKNIVIAGTEKITKSIINSAKNLKLIARVGAGIDNIDLDAAKEKNISICYTPDAPSQAVPEFTIALMLNLLKGISLSDRLMHQNIWYRPMGKMLSSMAVGIIGAGKIGTKVINLIKLVSPGSKVFYCDPYVEFIENATKCDIKELFCNSDIVSVHLPLNSQTKGLITLDLLKLMKQGGYLVNTSRGGIVDEIALCELLKNNYLNGAAIDVFDQEPYQFGVLTELNNCLLTSHIGSLTTEIRGLMEEQVTEDILRFIKNQPLLRPLNGFNFTGN